MESNDGGIGHSFYAKFVLMGLFIAADVYLNSKAEYEDLELDLSQLQVVLFGASIALQFSVTSALFLIVCNTVPFRLGLWDSLVDSTLLRLLLILAPTYLALGIILGSLRLNHIHVQEDVDVWRSWLYSTISPLHKIVAPCYYAANLRSALSFCDAKYYSMDIWIPSDPGKQQVSDTI